jgi:hypothetical protein
MGLKNLFRIPDPGVKKAPDPGSATLHTTDKKVLEKESLLVTKKPQALQRIARDLNHEYFLGRRKEREILQPSGIRIRQLKSMIKADP